MSAAPGLTPKLAHLRVKIGLFLGAIAVVYGLYVALREAAVEDWPTAPGVVESCEVAPAPLRIFSDRIRVTYRYVAGGSDRRGHRLTRSGFSPAASKFSAAEFRDAHPAGSPCTVRFNPENPSDACLIRAYEFAGYPFLLVGGGMLALSLWSLARCLLASR
jgi:hypothetical protein